MTPPSLRSVWALGVVVSLAAAISPMGGRQGDAQGPSFRARTDLLPIDVRVLDAHGQPVRDLGGSDFVVRIDGKLAPIETFAKIDAPATPASVHGDVPAEVAALHAVPRDVTTNVADDRRLVALVMDDAMAFDDQLLVAGAKSIGRQIVQRLGPSDAMAVIFTRQGSSAQDFTSDHALLNAAIDRFTAGTLYMQGVPAPVVGTGPAKSKLDSDSIYYEASMRTVMAATDALAEAPGRRKVLALVSPGAPVDPSIAAQVNRRIDAYSLVNRGIHEQLMEDMNAAFERAQGANVSVYSFDPSPNGAEQALLRFTASQGVPQPGPSHYTGQLSDDFLEEWASNTGGRAVLQGYKAPAGIDQMFSDNAFFYVLGCRLPSTQSPGPHRVEVKITRPGKFNVRAPTLYEANRSTAATTGPEAAVLAGLADVLPASAIRLEAFVASFADAGHKTDRVVISLGVVQPAPTQAIVHHLQVAERAFTPDGHRQEDAREETVTLSLNPSTTPDGTVAYELLSTLALRPGRHEVRLSVADTESKATGSVYLDLDAPDFSSLPLSLSDVALSASPGRPAVPPGALAGFIPLAPTAQRTFSAADAVTAFVRVYEPKQATSTPTSIDLQVLDDHGAVVADTVHPIAATAFDASTRAADLSVPVPVAGLAAGDYVLSLQPSGAPPSTARKLWFSVR